MRRMVLFLLVFLFVPRSFAEPLAMEKASRVVLVGSGLGARMMHYGLFETALHRRYPGAPSVHPQYV